MIIVFRESEKKSFILFVCSDSDTGDSMLSFDSMDPLKIAMEPVLRSFSAAEPVLRSVGSVSLDPVVSTTTGTTTIILPAIGANHTNIGNRGANQT